MKGLRSVVPTHTSMVSLCAIILTVLVVSHVHTESLFAPQTIPMSAGAAQDDPGPPIAAGTVVLIVYTISIPEYNLTIPSNFSRFAPGHDELLPNFEKAITGMKKGEAKRVDLGSQEAFGSYDESKQVEISKDRLPEDAEPGMMLATEDGTPCMVVDLSEDMATIDFNHPLAGKRVVIDVRILDVEMPPIDEFHILPENSVTGAQIRV
jgi:FKBP-type peptidyl-prolyl cis-trans isomerase 2